MPAYMTILCGTDFSPAAEQALLAAAHLAVRMQVQLQLAHCLQTSSKAHLAWVMDQLHQQAQRARELGADVRVHIQHGSPDEGLIALASEFRARLIAIGPLGERRGGKYRVGGHAERLVQQSHLPVLVVRDAEHFTAWLRKTRPLRVVIGADLSRSTDAAMSCIADWQRLAPCSVTAVHLYWPPQQFSRLGLDGIRSYIDPDPQVTETLTRELTQRLTRAEQYASFDVHVEPHLGRLGDRLADIAAKREADLLVVGSHPRTALARAWEGSVSHWALQSAKSSVLCVPAPSEPANVRATQLRNVLVATDFSPAGNAAVGLAYAACGAGGSVHLVHVLPLQAGSSAAPHDIFVLDRAGTADPRTERTLSMLTALAPADSGGRVTRCHVLESDQPSHAIAQAAARLGADAICIGRRGRSNLAETLLGSVSRDVLVRAECPVLLTQAPRE